MIINSINNCCYYFQGAVNIGYVNSGENGLLIDAGIDKATMKKVLKILKENELPVTYLFITHAHADHYGGAAYLQNTENIYTFAPAIEAAILRNPLLEPLYLFQGNMPLPEMRNKFLEGEPIVVDEEVAEGYHAFGDKKFQCIALPGHSINQFGVIIDEVLYAADAYFSEEQLHKHKIPFIIDAKATLNSLNLIKTIECVGALPGHGQYETAFQETVEANITYHLEILDSIQSIIDEQKEEGISHENVISLVCEKWLVELKNISMWMLFRTAITSYVTYLVSEEKVELFISNNKLRIKSK
ncbi:glyoxylase-like metal-dependent hydrolase (beta-lactamase superfamily II) [Metabacillus crassostreae]|uniref:MBL fold metallo-hydrolase n=1 Tax=Metabacillus crassostreae TaxID=929098 RepID=UPI00195C2CB7|nr:MBL fold metallo-hydrolase [Metabacillus crassostreae]MBM7604026.1 glyoxylase-like metal-dependent hydrolase (beta-lactamase superfamily II) [Metabacillus crassostreae]